jgi:hypothetical protein
MLDPRYLKPYRPARAVTGVAILFTSEFPSYDILWLTGHDLIILELVNDVVIILTQNQVRIMLREANCICFP